MKKISKGAKASIVFALSSIITKGIGIFTLPFFTNILTTAEIGYANVYTSWHTILFAVANLSLCSAAYNIGLKDFKDERNQFTSSLMTLSIISTCVLFTIYFIFKDFFNNYLTLSTPVMIIMFITFLVDPAFQFWIARQRFEYKYKKSAILTVVYSILVALASVICVWLLKDHEINLGEVKIFSSAIMIIIIELIFLIYIYIKGRHKITLKYWKYILPICLPLIIHSIGSQLLNVSDRVMISALVGEDAAGIYSTLYNISSLSLIFWAAINGSLIPFMFDKLSNKDTAKKELNTILISLIAFYGLFAIILTFIAPEIVGILTNDEYFAATYIIPPIAAGIYLTAVFHIFGNVLSFEKKTKYIMISTIITGVSNVILNYLLIPIFGYVAAAYTTLFCHIELCVLSYIFAKKTYKKDIMNAFALLLICIITISICLLINLLYSFIIVRYSIILIILLLCIIFRKKIFGIYKKIIKK